jgi:hypothetical protein
MKAFLIILLCWAVLSVPVCLFAAAFIRAGYRKKIDNREYSAVH